MPGAPTFFSEPEPGLFVVHYEDDAAMSPSLQDPLVAALEVAGKRGPVGICFRVKDAIPHVKLEVPTFWLGVTGRSELHLHAMAIVSLSIGVRLAAKGFAFSNKIRRIPIAVECFSDLEQAKKWAKETRVKMSGG